MKRLLIVLICYFIMGNYVYGKSPSFQTYMNPVIPGDHPDCTLTKIGNDFYTTGSSFNVTPVIFHSTDLVHWEAIAQPVRASWPNYSDKIFKKYWEDINGSHTFSLRYISCNYWINCNYNFWHSSVNCPFWKG